MSGNVGTWIRKQLELLKNWHSFVVKVTNLIHELYPDAEVYVFGSVVEGKITGASDIDIIVIIPDDVNTKEAYLKIVAYLEDKLGEDSYILDVHVVNRQDVEKPPYVWWIRKAVKIQQTRT